MPIELVPSNPYSEQAESLKTRLEEAMRPVCQLIDEANKAGFTVQWDTVGSAGPGFPVKMQGLRLARWF
jgi:hypothetical protein